MLLPLPKRDPNRPIGPAQVRAMAEAAIQMVQTIRDYLPILGDSAAKCEPAISDEMFNYAGALYQRIERLRNPQELPWPQSAGIWIEGPEGIDLHYKALCSALRPLCETYGWQGISDGSRAAHSSVLYGGPAIPEIAAGVLVAIEKPACRLLEMTSQTLDRDWQAMGTSWPSSGPHGNDDATSPTAGATGSLPKTVDDRHLVRRPKRSTEKGEGRAKLIAALSRHHKYAYGSCLNAEPIGCNELARRAGVSPSTSSVFFNDKFNHGKRGGHTKYKVKCQHPGSLADALKALRGEFTPAEMSRMTLDAYEAGREVRTASRCSARSIVRHHLPNTCKDFFALQRTAVAGISRQCSCCSASTMPNSAPTGMRAALRGLRPVGAIHHGYDSSPGLAAPRGCGGLRHLTPAAMAADT